MILCFTLTMPNNNSWNGRFSGENNLYARCIDFGRSKLAKEKAQVILDKGQYYYNFGDGWGARVTVMEVTSSDATKIRKKSIGFLGYDWMIKSIREHNNIVCD